MFDEDLSVFFNTAEMAVSAIFDATGANLTVPVIHDRAGLVALNVATTNPVALVKASDFPDDSCVGKTLQIGSTVFTIRDTDPQDDGAIVLLQLSL